LNSCSGTPVGNSYSGYNYRWYTYNSNIASIADSGQNQSVNLYGAGIGSTSIIGYASDAWCTASSSGGATVIPSVSIYSGSTNITGTTQPVVVGQQIALSTQYSLPSGVTVTSQSWSVPGNTVGGFPGDGTVTSTNFGNVGSTTFYWVTVGTAGQATYQVTYTLNTSAGTFAASATFNVYGPTNVIASEAADGAVNIANNDVMQLGDPAVAMDFSASAAAANNNPGTFWWVQLISSSTYTDTPFSGAPITCTASSGALDTQFPYDTGTKPVDSPSIDLLSQLSQVSDNDTFTMYVMWNPGGAGSIPVPLGYLAWNWNGVANQNQSTGVWTLQASGVSTNNFIPSTQFPTWKTVVNAETGQGITCN